MNTRTFKWTVEFKVAEEWVADGFELTDERALAMLAGDLGYACMETELSARVIKAPLKARIMRVQGYEEAAIAKATKP